MSSRDWCGSVVVLTAVLSLPVFAHEAYGAEEKIILRTEALRRPAAVDCSEITARPTPGRSFPRATDSLVRVGAPIQLNAEDAPTSLTGGVWSPSGDSVAFVAPTERAHALNREPSRDGRPVPAALSVNEIWLYQFADKKWSKITGDGARPRFSRDGKRLLYISPSKGARSVDLETFADESVSGPEIGDPNRQFQTLVLDDGSVLSPERSGKILRHTATLDSSWPSIELAPDDEVRMSPDGERIAVYYNSESAVVVYDRAGNATTVLKNCPGAAAHLTWSPDGKSVAYPMRATGQSEVWISNLRGGKPETRLRLQPLEDIGVVSLSPQNKFVAFSHAGPREREAIWIASKTGRQRVAAGGLIGSWSLQGDRLLYAVRRPGGGLDWYVVSVEETQDR